MIDLQAISEGGVPRVSRLMALSVERQANALRQWVATQSVPVPSFETLREWLRQLTSTNATQAILLGFAKDGPNVRVYRDQLLIEWPTGDWRQVQWTGEANVALGDLAGHVTFSEAAPSDALSPLRQPAPGESWLIRRRLPGDRVQLSEASGHVSLKNVMQNAGVPPWLREVWPLLICNNQIAAIAGVVTANHYKVRPGERGLACEWKPAWPPALHS
jgi:tRNA(Ile)-lysidine synthase